MAQWVPFEGMDALRREIDRAFEDYGLRTFPPFRTAFLPGRAARGYPLMNVYEDSNAVYVEALAPGVSPASLNASVVRDKLTIAGEKASAKEVKAEAFHRNERAAGTFSRTIELPVEVDDTKVQADYRDGVLLVTLPKAEKARPKQISVQVG
jgi:HSP20 family protein